MAILRVLFRRATPGRLRLQALMNVSAFCFVVGMTLMTSAVSYFLLVPYLFKDNGPVMQAHRSVIVYMFVNVVGNFILCIFTDTSVAKRGVGTNSVDCRLTTAVNRVSTKARGNDLRSKSRPQRGSKGQGSTQRSDNSTANKSSQKSVSGTSNIRINAPVCGQSMNPSTDASSADSNPQKICSSKESSQTDSPTTTSACEDKTVSEAATSTSHFLLHDQISSDGTLGSGESMGSGRTAAQCDLRPDSDSKTLASDTHGANTGTSGFLSHVSNIFSYSSSKPASTGQTKYKQSEKNAARSIPDESKKTCTSDTLQSRQRASDVVQKTDNSDLGNGVDVELLTRMKSENVPLEENPADHTLQNSVDVTGTSSTSITSKDDEASSNSNDSSHLQTSNTDVEPLRSHHCPLCEKRILRRDHHCFFMTVCVGYHNHKHFIFFCLFMMAGTFHAVVLIARFLKVVYGVQFYGPQTFFFLLVKVVDDVLQKGVFPQPLMAFLLYEMYACLLVGMSTGGFLYWHLVIAVSGQTTHEATRGDRRYSQGRLANIRDLFGPYWPLMFILPLPLPQARDGAHYTANPDNQGRKQAKDSKVKGSKAKDKNFKDNKSPRTDKDGDSAPKDSTGRTTQSRGRPRSVAGQDHSGSKRNEAGNNAKIRKRKAW